MPKYWALGAVLTVSIGWPLAAAADVTVPDEYGKTIQQHSRIGTLDGGLFGDHVGLSTGSLEIVQTDVDLPGNNALPVRVGRRFVVGSAPAKGHFGDWELDIPYLHGIFGAPTLQGGWLDHDGTDQRCTNFGPPPEISVYGGFFDPNEYWLGSSLYLPGTGDQELLIGGDVPPSGGIWPVSTREGAAVRCLASLAPTSEAGSTGEGFEVVTPDGTHYTFDQMVSRFADAVSKSDSAVELQAKRRAHGEAPLTDTTTNAPTCCRLQRKEVLIYPTRVTDRFGNTVTYTWSATNPWQLTGITASDGRNIQITYSSSDPDLIQSVTATASDAPSRTWSYAYAEGATSLFLATVTQPDLQAWHYALDALWSARTTTSGSTCDSIYNGGGTLTGTMTAPTGAAVAYTLTRTTFGRSWVPWNCRPSGDREYATEPYLFLGNAITSKTITGPGLPSGGLTWTYEYGVPNNCWDPSGAPTDDPDAVVCTGNSPTSRTTTVIEPDATKSRYTFGNRMMDGIEVKGNEGLLLMEEHGVSGTSALRKTTFTYGAGDAAPYASSQGHSVRLRGDWRITGQRRPQQSAITTLQTQTFAWSVPQTCSGNYCFDTRARPTTIVRSGPSGTRTETTTYADNTTLWILGQVSQVKCVAPTAALPAGCGTLGTVMSSTTYDSATALPLSTSAFGKLTGTYTYDTSTGDQDGTLKTVKDGNNNVTTYTGWKRGIPTSVHFPATTESPTGATRTAVVDDRGWIASVTDENQFITGYQYDAMGRITVVTYPANEGWATTNSDFKPVGTAENGLAAGHWRQRIHTGSGYKDTLFDALWRPVLVHEYDQNASGTDRYTATAYDKAGRVADVSYPLTAAPTMGLDGTWTLLGARPAGVRTTYDALGRPVTVKQDSELDAPLNVLTTTTAYLTTGFKRRVTDARGNATTEQFMAWDTPTFDLPVQIDAPEGQSTTITRDIFGKPTSITRGGNP